MQYSTGQVFLFFVSFVSCCLFALLYDFMASSEDCCFLRPVSCRFVFKGFGWVRPGKSSKTYWSPERVSARQDRRHSQELVCTTSPSSPDSSHSSCTLLCPAAAHFFRLCFCCCFCLSSPHAFLSMEVCDDLAIALSRSWTSLLFGEREV